MSYLCPRCAADPKPENFATPRKCAFTESGDFTPDNWNCATLGEVMWVACGRMVETRDSDTSIHVIPAYVEVDDIGPLGFLVLTRYKRRGCDSSAVFVGDYWPPKKVTLEKVERVIEELASRERRGV